MAKIMIDGDLVEGKNITVKNGKVIIDGIEKMGFGDVKIIELRILEGVVENIDSDGSVSALDVAGRIDCGGSVTCGNVGGNVDAGGSVDCQDVAGDVDAGGSVNCETIRGKLVAGGSVRMGR
jgi:hypothetical protein